MEKFKIIAESYSEEEANYIIDVLKKKRIECKKEKIEENGFEKITLSVSEGVFETASKILKEDDDEATREPGVVCPRCSVANVTTEWESIDDHALIAENVMMYVCRNCDHKWIKKI